MKLNIFAQEFRNFVRSLLYYYKGRIVKRLINILFVAFVFALPSVMNAQSADSVAVESDTVMKREGLVTRILRYFEDSNKEKSDKKFDVSVIGGPYYSSDMKLGVGLVGAGLYRMAGCDSLMQPSNVSLFGSVSTVGFYMIGIRGNNLFPEDKYRLNYTLFFYSFPSYYWGIGYDNASRNSNKTEIDRFQARMKVDFLIKLCDNFYIGPSLMWDYAHAGDVATYERYLFEGMSLTQRNYGLGASVQYDTRDYINNASRGIYLYLAQAFRPGWLGNDQTFSTTEFIARGYKTVWNGGILAGEMRGTFNFGEPAWSLMAELGAGGSMRGYYEGRYRDKHSIAAQVELRQHVWRRSGITMWVGAGNVFHDTRTFKKVLPNYGVGYRWEFKKRVNVRLDLGFGKSGQNGFTFNINEAF